MPRSKPKFKILTSDYPQIKVGVYELGFEFIDLYALPKEQGGYYYFQPEEGHVGRMKVGIGYRNWWEVVAVLLHEATEYVMHKQGYVYQRAGQVCHASDCRTFHFNHEQFSEVTAHVAIFIARALPDLASVWRKHIKP